MELKAHREDARRKLSGRIVSLLLEQSLSSPPFTCRSIFATSMSEAGGCHLLFGVLRRSGGRIVTDVEREESLEQG